MANDGSAALGAPEVGGCLINPRGFSKKMMMGGALTGGGAVGALASMAVASRQSKASEVPKFGRVGYLAASESEVAVIKMKSGAVKMKTTDQTLVRAPRDELESVELKKGKLAGVLTLRFVNGVVWEFDAPRATTKDAVALVGALGGSVI